MRHKNIGKTKRKTPRGTLEIDLSAIPAKDRERVGKQILAEILMMPDVDEDGHLVEDTVH